MPAVDRERGDIVSTRPFAQLLEDGRLAIHATKALYILTPGEVLALLPSCKSLWVVAIERGKTLRRTERTKRFINGREGGGEER